MSAVTNAVSRFVEVFEYINEHYKPDSKSITRRMSDMVDLLKKQGFTDLISLGPGYPSPLVSTPEADDAHYQRYIKWVAAQKGQSVSKFLRDVRNYGSTSGDEFTKRNFGEVYPKDFGGKESWDPKNMVQVTGGTGAIDLMVSAMLQIHANDIGKEIFKALREVYKTQGVAGLVRMFSTDDSTAFDKIVAKASKKIAVFCDSPTYAGLPARTNENKDRIDLFSADMDGEGPLPEKFEQRIKDALAQGYELGFYYSIPDGHNPGGITFSQKRREEIYDICQKYGLLILEDSPYGYITFQEAKDRPKPFFVIEQERRAQATEGKKHKNIVTHAFTASKIGDPAKRICYMHTETEFRINQEEGTTKLVTQLDKIIARRNLFSNMEDYYRFDSLLRKETPVTTEDQTKIQAAKGPLTRLWEGARNLAKRVFGLAEVPNEEAIGDFKPHTLWERADFRRNIYKQARDAVYEILNEELGDLMEGPERLIDITYPDSGFFGVLTFLDPNLQFQVDDEFMMEHYIRPHKVLAIPMQEFYAPDAFERARAEGQRVPLPMRQIRLAYSSTKNDEDPKRLDELREGARRFSRATRQVLHHHYGATRAPITRVARAMV